MPTTPPIDVSDEWPPADSSKTVDALRRRLQQTGIIVLRGAPGSGRGILANRLLTVPGAGAAATVAALPQFVDDAYALLRVFAPDITDSNAVEHVAATAVLPTRIIVREAHFSDVLSFRTLLQLARRGAHQVVLITSTDSALPAPAGSVVVEHVVQPLSVRRTGELVTARYGHPLLRGDMAALHAMSGGNYRALRWLLDRAHAVGALYIDHSILRIAAPRQTRGTWVLGDLKTPSLRAIAIADELPAAWVRGNIPEAELIELQESDRVRVIDGQIRLASPAHAIEVRAHMVSERRRAIVLRLIDEPTVSALIEAGLTHRAAARLWDESFDLDLSPPTALLALARRGYLALGRATAAAALPLSPAAPPRERLDHAFAIALSDAPASISAIQQNGLDADERLELAVIIMVALLRNDMASAAFQLETLISTLPVEHRDVATAFRACTIFDADFDAAALTRMSQRNDASDIIRGFALRTLAIHSVGNGQPGTAIEYLEAGRDLSRLPVQQAIDEVVAALAALEPEYSDDSIRRYPAPGTIPTYDLIEAVTSAYGGNLAMCLAQLNAAFASPNIETHPVAPIMHGFASFASSLLNEHDDARRHLRGLRAATPHSPLFAMLGVFAEGLAVTNLAEAPHRIAEAYALFVQAGEQASAIGWRTMAIISRAGAGLIAEERGGSPMFRAIVETAKSGPSLEGAVRLYAVAAAAALSNDTATLASVAVQLHSRGLLLDAIGLSSSLPRGDSTVSRSVERALTRLTRIRVDRKATRWGVEGILTPREHEIAGFAARGLTDREIAALLHLSPRTVSTHVSRVLRKLDVPTRQQIGDALRS